MRAAKNPEFLPTEVFDDHVMEVATLATSSMAALFEVSKNAAVAAAACDDARLFLWKLPQKEVMRRIDLAGQSIDALAISPDGSLIAAGDHSGSYSVWETSTGERKLDLRTSFYPFRLAFSPDSKH